jgi:hypothetical protein
MSGKDPSLTLYSHKKIKVYKSVMFKEIEWEKEMEEEK